MNNFDFSMLPGSQPQQGVPQQMQPPVQQPMQASQQAQALQQAAAQQQPKQLDFSMLPGSNRPSPAEQALTDFDKTENNTNTPITEQLSNMAKAIAIGGFHGVDRFATTLLKAGAKSGILPGITPESVQATYNQNTEDYNKSRENNPKATIAGDLLGSGVVTAPLMAIPGAQGAGVGSLAAVGKLGLNATSLGAQGAAMGALSTEAGQDPNSILNAQGAKEGGIVGAVLGGTLGPMASAYLNKTGALAEAQQAAKASGYEGQMFATDLPSTGWVDDAKKWVTDSVLGKLPIFGTAAARDVQSQQIQKAMYQYVNNLSKDTVQTGPRAIGQILQKHADELKGEYTGLWNKFVQSVPKDNVPLTTSNKAIVDLKAMVNQNKPSDLGLSATEAKIINGLPTDQATSLAINDAKKQVWDIYNRVQGTINKGGENPNLLDIADATKQTYWNLLGDMKNGIQRVQGDASTALRAFNDANEFTKGYKNLFDPKLRPQLMNAINDSADQAGKVSDFMRWLNSPTTSAAEVGKASQVLGASGQQAAAGYGLQQAYQKSMNQVNGQPVFDIANFLGEVNKMDSSAQKALYAPALDAMSGLRQVASDWAQATNASKGSGGMGAAIGGLVGSLAPGAAAIGAIAHASPLTIGLAATPPVLSFLAANSPLKNILINLSHVISNGAPSSVMKFLSNKAVDMLQRAGIQTMQGNDGKVVMDKPKAAAELMKVSLNDQYPVYHSIIKPQAPKVEEGPKQFIPNPPSWNVNGPIRT